MNKSQRIHIDVTKPTADSHIIVKLDQEVDTLEFLSMTLGVNDIYQDFNADYGVLIGRVIANGGIGIPNAKISIFIPLTDADANIGEIASIYPYTLPSDKNNDGKRYNLLPRVSQIDPNTGVSSPKQPFGSFPIKPELVTNLEFLDVYKKYYKYTALTNSAGDYMIFGVPTGTQTVHLSVDITDIGKYSMNPAAMVTNLGYSPNLFMDNNTKIKPSNDLGDLPNIETQEISVDIAPFWGDTSNFTIGITRQDFRIRATLINTFTIFGSVFTDAYKTMWGRGTTNDKKSVWLLYQIGVDNGKTPRVNIGAGRKRPATVTEKIYYYPTSITDAQIATNNYVDQMVLLDPTEYSLYKREGDFAAIVNCNRRKVVTDDFGNEVVVADDAPDGIFTRFTGFMTLEISDQLYPLNWESDGDHVEMTPIRQKLKFPQYANEGHSFLNPATCGAQCQDINIPENNAWRAQHYSFTGGSLYSISKFHGLVANNNNECAHAGMSGGFIRCDCVNKANWKDGWDVNATIIQTNDYGVSGGSNTRIEFPTNAAIYGCSNCEGLTSMETFGANWMNLSVYLPQTGWVYNNYSYIYCWRTNSQFTMAVQNPNQNYYFTTPNKQLIAGKYTDTCSFARSDLNWTDFIPVTKSDIIKMNEVPTKGFKTADDGKTINVLGYSLEGTYRNGNYKPSYNCAPAPMKGGKCNGDSLCGCNDCRTYFFKGIDTSDCVAFITCLGIV